jgi:hypothetical protein
MMVKSVIDVPASDPIAVEESRQVIDKLLQKIEIYPVV